MTRWLRGVLIVALGAGIVLLAYVAGREAAKPHEFDWAVAADVGVALGTLALALGTLALAYSTAAVVRYAKQEHDRETRPLVAPTTRLVPADEFGSPQRLIVGVTNIGRGPARNVTVKLATRPPGGTMADETEIWTAATPALGAGATHEFLDEPVDSGTERVDFRTYGTFWDADFKAQHEMLPPNPDTAAT